MLKTYYITKIILLTLLAIPLFFLLLITNGLKNRARAKRSGL